MATTGIAEPRSANRNQPAAMDARQNKTAQLFMWVGLGVILLLAVLIALIPPPGELRVLEAGAVLTAIPLVAVGIERVIEFLWTLVNFRFEPVWPIAMMQAKITKVQADIGTTALEFREMAKRALDEAKDRQELTAQQVDRALKELDNIEAQVEKFKGLAYNDPQMREATSTLLRQIKVLKDFYPTATGLTALAGETIDTLSGVLGRFEENPGRQLISLYLSAVLGLLIAWGFGLDAFAAVWGNPQGTENTLVQSQTR